MGKYGLLVLATPKQGREAEYIDWHMNHHVPEIITVPGFISCRRYKLADFQPNVDAPTWQFMTLYEIETDDLPKTIALMRKKSAAGTQSDAKNALKTVVLTWEQASLHFCPARQKESEAES